MFAFLKRIFGGSTTASTPPSNMAASVKPSPTARVRLEPRREGTASHDETIIYRRQTSSEGGFRGGRQGGIPASTGTAVCLVVLVGSKKGLHFAVPPQGAVIGRSETCDLVLADQHVSSKHAWVGMVDGVTVIRDLDSTNGTFRNASSENVAENTPLVIGDTIMLGGHYGVQLRVVRAESTGTPGVGPNV